MEYFAVVLSLGSLSQPLQLFDLCCSLDYIINLGKLLCARGGIIDVNSHPLVVAPSVDFLRGLDQDWGMSIEPVP